MSSRNEQFVWFTAAVAIALPAAMWFRYVGPLRQSVADDRRTLTHMRDSLAAYTEADLLPRSEVDQREADRIRRTRDAIRGLTGAPLSVSEIYQAIENAAAPTGLTVGRIEPSRSQDSAEFKGPLGKRGIAVQSRTYRVEISGSVEDLPTFLQRLEVGTGFTAVRQVQVQFQAADGVGPTVSATVELEAMTVTPATDKRASP